MATNDGGKILSVEMVLRMRLYESPYMFTPADVAECVQRAMVRYRGSYEGGFTDPDAYGELTDRNGMPVGKWELFAKRRTP